MGRGTVDEARGPVVCQRPTLVMNDPGAPTELAAHKPPRGDVESRVRRTHLVVQGSEPGRRVSPGHFGGGLEMGCLGDVLQ